MKGFSTLLLVVISVTIAAAQNDNYTALNGPFGGPIEDIISIDTRLIGTVHGQGIVVSDDGGATWTESNSGLTDFRINDLEIDPVSGKIYALGYYRLFSSSDNGDSWVVVATSGFSQGNIIKRSPTGNLFIATEWSGKIYRSTDGGTTWPASASTTLPGSPYIMDFEISSTGYLFVATRGSGVFRSNSPNSTVGFTQLGESEGLTGSDGSSLLSLGTDMYVTTNAGPYKSSNNGASWVSIKSNITTFNSNSFIRQRGGTLFLLNAGTEKLWKSETQGADWTELSYPMNNYGNEYSYPVFLYAESPTTLYVSYQIGTFKSTDGGLNWFEINNGITGLDLNYRDVMVMTDNGRLLYARNWYFGFHISIDDGATWDLSYAPPLDRQIFGFKKIGSTIYAYGGGGLVKTENNGDLWTEVFPENACNPHLTNLAIADANNFYSISDYNCNTGVNEYHLNQSSDAGVTWTSIPISGLPSMVDAYYLQESGFLTDGSGNGYILLYSNTLNKHQIFKITLADGQATDISPIDFTITNAFEYFNGKLYAGATSINGHKFLTSTDGGQNWTAKNLPSAYGRIKAINDNTIYLLSTNAYISTDGGDSWVDTGTFGNGRQATTAIISPANYSYISVADAALYKSTALVIPPAAPTNLSVFGNSAFTVGLKWDDNADNEQYFIIERSDGNNTGYDSVGRVLPNSNNFKIVNAGVPNDNSLYYFRVRAVGAAGKSTYSNEVSVTTIENCDTYTIPTNRSWTATTLNESGAGVFINNVVAINGTNGNYQVTDLTAGATTGITPAISEAVFSSFQEVCGKVYMTTLSPLYANGNGTWDAGTNTLTIHWQTRPNYTPYRAETTAFTLNDTDPAPGAPSNLGAYIKTENEIVVSWSPSQFAQQYQVQRSETSGSGFVDVGTPFIAGTQLLFVDNLNFNSGATYYYRVVATALGGASTSSPEVSVEFQTPLFTAISLPGYDFSTQGISWIDLDNDDDDDLLVTPFNMPNGNLGIFENMGDGSFQKIDVPGISDNTAFTSLEHTTVRAISVGDVNNDGLTDFLTISSQTGGDIWINQGNKVFERKHFSPPDNSAFAWYGQLVDFNNDGRLDAVISQDNPTPGASSTFMKMFVQTAEGEFEPYELGEIAADASLSRGGSWADYDNDGDQDFLRSRFLSQAADFDQLYNNNGDGTFTSLSGTAFEADFSLGSRSMNWGDFDNDLDLDVYVVNNLGIQNSMLYQNNGDGTFTRLTANLLSEPQTRGSFGSAWGDVDNDGDLDMVVANTSQSYLYLNDGAGNFTKHVGGEYLVAFDVSRTNIAFAFSDYDKNGTLDIATGKNLSDFPTILLKNNLLPGVNSQWLEVKLKGAVSNQSAIGAHITIETPDGKKQMRAISSLTGYGSAGSLVAHFGLKDQSSVKSIRVFWPSGTTQTLTNKSANQIIEIVEDGTGPQPTTLLPANSATGVHTTTNIEITLNESSEAMAGKNIKIVLASDPSTIVFTADVTTGTKTGEKYFFSIPDKLHVATAYHVIVDEGAFEDIWENPSPAITGTQWSFTTDPGPVVTTFSPSPDATIVPIHANLEITFDQAVTLVDGKRIRVLDGASEILNVNVTSGTFSGMKYILNPATDFPGEKLLAVIIDRGAFLDADMNDFTGVAAGQWTFTTSETTKPELVVDPAPLAILNKGFAAVTFNVTATDNVEVAAVSFRYRKSTSKDFTPVPMQKITGSPETWTLQVTNAFPDDMGFEFYIEATDPGGNKARSPQVETQYHQSRIRFAENNRPVISVPGQGTVQSWKIIAIPHDIGTSAPQISDVFEEMGTASPTTWRMINYTNVPEEDWLEYPEFPTIQRGKGYFINSNAARNIQLDNPASPPFSQNNLFAMQLVQGWNQIGNPYTVAINWDDVRTFNDAEAIVGRVKLYTNGSYVDASDILPMQGGFVLAQSPITIPVSFPGQTTSGGRSKSIETVGSDLGSDSWIVPLELSQGDFVNDFGGVGMHPEASDSFDQFDDANAPRFMNYLEINFSHPEHFIKRFARDVVPTRKEYFWTFNITSNIEGEVHLRWNNAEFGSNENDLFLLDEKHQVIVNMRTHAHYVFNPAASSAFRIYFGEHLQEKVLPWGISLGLPYPNPSGGEITIPYSIPDGGSDAHVQLEVYDMMGKKVASLVNARIPPGYYTETWDSGMSEATSGVYTCRLLVLSGSHRVVRTGKIIINR